MPKISVIIPCYNSREFVERTLSSVQNQTLIDWECIIVDDGSIDDSASIVQNYISNEPRMKLIRQRNGGVCNARNNGYSACSPDSQYLFFLDADDTLAPQMLQDMTRYLDENPRVGLAHCAFVRIDEQDRICEPPVHVTRFVPRYRGGWGLRKLTKNRVATPFAAIFATAFVLTCSSVIRKSVYRETEGWDEKIGQHGEERDLFLRIALLSQVHYIPRFYLNYRVHSSQSTSVRTQDKVDYTAKWYRKWQSLSMSTEQRKLYREGWLFMEATVSPYLRVCAAKNNWRERKFVQAGRHFVWAAVRCLQRRLLTKNPF